MEDPRSLSLDTDLLRLLSPEEGDLSLLSSLFFIGLLDLDFLLAPDVVLFLSRDGDLLLTLSREDDLCLLLILVSSLDWD